MGNQPTGNHTGKSRGKSHQQQSQRAGKQRSSEVDEVRKKNLVDGPTTARADYEDGDPSADEGYDVVMYIGCMLNNGRALANANPNDFEFSPDEDVNQVQVGDGVRICDGRERFWTRVYAIEDDLLMAQVGSKLNSGRWALGERVCFLRKHAYAVELNTAC